MKHLCKRAAALVLALAFCLALAACQSGPKQEAASNGQEAADHFFASLAAGDYPMARTYFKEGNRLLYVLPTGEEDAEPPVPEMAEVFERFCARLPGFSYRFVEGEVTTNGMVYAEVTQLDFAGAIRTAMLEALEAQCSGGGGEFADYTGWLLRGLDAAAMGSEGSGRTSFGSTNGVYTTDHRGYTDHDFLNLLTGGFYDYVDFQMAVCSATIDGIDHVWYFAAQGDEIIASLEEVSIEDTAGEYDEETVAGLNTFYHEVAEATPGLYAGMYRQGSRVTACTGIDFVEADQNALVNAGLVSGRYQGNMVNGWLSLRTTLASFEKDGILCSVTPTYPEEG